MFKKDISSGNQTVLNMKDSRHILMKILHSSPDSIPKDNTLVEIRCDFTGNGSVFRRTSDSEILGARINREEYIPSVYAVWDYSPAMPFVTVRSDVSHFILGGAHLMIPGILRPGYASRCISFNAGDTVLIRVSSNEIPFALGKALLSSMALESAPEGTKGKAVEVTHVFGDGLWRLGSRRIPSGFGFDRIEAPQQTECVSAPKVLDEKNTKPSIHFDESEYDGFVLDSFMCVAKCCNEENLPMNASSLISRMQLASRRLLISRRIGSEEEREKFKLDLKRSSFKQGKMLLQVLQDRNLLSCKQIRGESVIVKISFDNPNIKAFPVPPEIVKKPTTSPSVVQLVSVKTWWVLNSKWTAILGREPKPQGSQKELIDRLTAYLRTVKGGSVDLSEHPELAQVMARREIAMVEKSEIVSNFAKDLEPQYLLSTELPPRIRKGTPPLIHVTVKRVQGSKHCTIIKGLKSYYLNETDISSMISSAFKVSASVTEDGVYCQGKLAAKLEQFLIESVGIPKSSIVLAG